MKFLIASDIHGSSHYCKLFQELSEKLNPQKIILLGDLLYHGARNSLPHDYSTLETAAILNSMKEKLLCVRGNCDSEVDELVLDFPIGASYCILPIGNRTAIFTHGHREVCKLQRGDILFQGHFHVPAFEERENEILSVNCGSVSIPKQNSPHSCLLLEDDLLTFYNVETKQPFRKERIRPF